MPVQLSIIVGNNDALMALGYTRLELWISRDQGNTYAEITSPAQTAASIASSPADNLFRVGDHLLKFKVNGGPELAVAFGPASILDLYTPAQVAAAINAVSPGLATAVGLTVVLTSPTSGRASQLEITYNDASDLGFTAGTQANGTDVRLTLVGGTLLYQYTDVIGTPDDFYEYRFSANGSLPISNFSDPISGAIPPLIAVGNLSVMTGKFVDIAGRPKKTTVIIAPDGSSPQQLFGYSVGGTNVMTFETDDNGVLAVPFVRGTVLRVAIEGTPLVRIITVPDAPSFDLLTVLAAAVDPYTIQLAPPLLTRTGP